jgi:hypothetical protein
LRGKDDGKIDGLNYCRIDKGRGQRLEVVGKWQQIAADIDGCVAVNAGPQRRVGGIFASHGVVTDELEGQGVVVNEQIRRNREVGFLVIGVGASEFAGRGLNGREDRSVKREPELAELRNQSGRKRVVDMDGCGARNVRLGQHEIYIVLPVDAVQFDLWRAGFSEGEGVVILAWRNRSICRGIGAGGIGSDGCASRLSRVGGARRAGRGMRRGQGVLRLSECSR